MVLSPPSGLLRMVEDEMGLGSRNFEVCFYVQLDIERPLQLNLNIADAARAVVKSSPVDVRPRSGVGRSSVLPTRS